MKVLVVKRADEIVAGDEISVLFERLPGIEHRPHPVTVGYAFLAGDRVSLGTDVGGGFLPADGLLCVYTEVAL